MAVTGGPVFIEEKYSADKWANIVYVPNINTSQSVTTIGSNIQSNFNMKMKKTNGDGTVEIVDIPVSYDGTVHVDLAAFIKLMERLGYVID